MWFGIWEFRSFAHPTLANERFTNVGLVVMWDVVVGLVVILLSFAQYGWGLVDILHSSGFFRKANADDVTALLALRDALVGLDKLHGWSGLETHRDPFKCEGVSVGFFGRVTKLFIKPLSGIERLSGILPSEVGLLTALEKFDCGNNELEGTCFANPMHAFSFVEPVFR